MFRIDRWPLVFLTCVCLHRPVPSAEQAASVAVKDLRCEYLVDPVGIDERAPRLSWILESPERGQVQSAYRILVASSPEALARDEGDLWDTGRIESGRAAQIPYAGKALGSRRACWWKVRVWDGSGRASFWSAPARWSMGLLEPADWKAEWIGCDAAPADTSAAPFLRKEIEVKKGSVRRATVYATAAGVFELHLNGRRVGDEIFMPGWTEYSKRVYYRTYDVTSLVREGANVLGAIIGDGWYGLHHGGRGKLRMKAQLEVEMADGTSQVVATDGTWRGTAGGPIRSSDMYNGEAHDARLEMPGWSEPGFDDSSWKPVVVGAQSRGTWTDVTERVRAAVKDGALSVLATNAAFGDPVYGTVKQLRVEYSLGGPKKTTSVLENQTLEIRPGAGEKLEIVKAEYGAESAASQITTAILQAYPGVPVRRVGFLQPRKVTEPKAGAHVFDLGQNFTGWARLRVKGPAGTKVTLRFAEMLNPDGTIYTTNLRGAKCTDTYVLSGRGKDGAAEEIWEPSFTFHGFRYVEVTGYPGSFADDAILGFFVCSDVSLTSKFDCSNPMLNQLWSNIVSGQRSNYLEVPTDCPQRDERLGWTGDAQAFIGTGTYNQDLAAFFTSWLVTLNDSQRPDGGYTDVSPRGGGVSAGWSDAGVVCPWTLWRVYGDTRVIERYFDKMLLWIEHCEKNSKGLLRPAEGYGDWLNVGAEMPKDVIATAWFAWSTSLLAEMARTIGKEAEAARLEGLLARIREAFNKAYVGADGKIKGDTQTTYLMAIAYGLLPPEKERLAEKLLLQRIEERNWHLSTGFLGVNLLLPTLTRIGRTDVALRLLQNETYPSWGYPVKHGATTIWERWDGWTEEKGFQDPGMNSFNHYAYGSCGQWMFSTLAGIDTDGPGFERILVRPRPGGGIQYCEARYDSICGRIATRWDVDGEQFRLSVTVPANARATVWVPAKDAERVTEGGKPARDAVGVKLLRAAEGAAIFEIGSGQYSFASRP